MRLRVLAAATILALLVGASVTTAATRERVVAKKTASGDYAVALTSATVKRPSRIRVRVTSSPRQRASVNWTILCSRGLSASTKSGAANVSTPATRTIRHPMLKSADDCIVSATAQLDGSGRLTVALLARRR